MHRPLSLLSGVVLVGAVILASPTVIDAGWRLLPDRISGEQSGSAGIPADTPALGLVYQGLQVAAKGAPCAGSFQLFSRETCSHGPDPAPPGLFVGRDVKPVTPSAPTPKQPERELTPAPVDAEVVRDEAAVTPASDRPVMIADPAPADEPFAVGDDGVACAGDGRAGKRVQVLYLYEFGKPSRYPQYLGSLRTWAAGVDAIFAASAEETGGIRRIRYVTTPRCRVDVAEVQVPAGALGSLESNIKALSQLGYNRTDRKYLIFADANVYCGISTYVGDRRPGPGNRNNGGPSYGRADAGCWSTAVAGHQLAHTMGAVLDNAPHSTKAGHCTDGYDLMCYRDTPTTTMRVACPDKGHQRRLDCNHDDYFHTNPRPGSFLARNWNVADSDFLLREPDDRRRAAAPPVAQEPAQPSPATAPTPSTAVLVTATPSRSAEPTPSGSVSPSQSTGPAQDGPPSSDPPQPESSAQTSPGDSPAPSAPAADPPAAADAPPALEPVLQLSETTSTASRLVWTAAERGTRYEVAVNGQPVATTEATRARLIGLQPDTEYRIEVRLADAARTSYAAPVRVRTAPVAQPTPGAWFVLANALTSTAADLYAARTAAGTPLVLNGTEGGAQQLWQLQPVGNGSFQMVSRASGKCVLPLGGNPVAGTPLVQGPCTKGETTHYWGIGRSGHGFTLHTPRGDLVVGVGTQRVGGSRVLVLQKPDKSRHQSWAALPG